MLYTASITTNANTPLNAPTQTIIKVAREVLHRFYVYFPPGCSGLVYVQIMHGEHPILPVNKGSWMRGDDLLIEGPTWQELTSETNIMTINTANLDTVNTHEVLVGLFIDQKGVLLPIGAYEGIISALKSLVWRGVPV